MNYLFNLSRFVILGSMMTFSPIISQSQGGLKEALSSNKSKSGDSKKSTKEDSDSPLRVVADEMRCDQKTNVCIASGNAFAEKMNDPRQKTITAKEFHVHFEKKETDKNDKSKKKNIFKSMQEKPDEEEKSPKTTLKKIEAFHDVVMTDINSVIRSDQAVYYAESDTVDLEGNVSLTQGKNQLTGTHGFANLKDETYKITNQNGRVEGLFYQKEKKSDE